MGLVMDTTQMLGRNGGVDFSRIDPHVSQQGLDRAQVRAMIEHKGRASVPEQVRAAPGGHAGGCQVASHDFTPRARGETVTICGELAHLSRDPARTGGRFSRDTVGDSV
jgi:hypothetical protein